MAFTHQKKMVVAWLLVAVIGGLVGCHGYYRARNIRIVDTIRLARGSALIMNVSELETLTGVAEDEQQPGYLRLKERLMAIKRLKPAVHCVYIFRRDPESGEKVCIVDSMPVDSAEYTPPGQIISGMGPADREQLAALPPGEVVFNESMSDIFGLWVAVYTRIDDGGMIPKYLRADLSVDDWRAALLEIAVMRALVAWLFLGIPLVVYQLARRESKQAFFIKILSTAVEQCAQAMLIMDEKGVILFVNPALNALSKYSPGDLVGKEWRSSTEGMEPEQLERIAFLSSEGKTWIEDIVCERKGGEKYMARISSTPICDKSGRVVGFINFVTDITEYTEQMKALHNAKRKAEAADRAKSNFIATMSHEVRTPLNGIIGFSDLLRDTRLDSEQQEYVDAIHTSSMVLMNLADNVLNYSRVESGSMQAELAPCDIYALVDDVLEIVRPCALGKELRLFSMVPATLPRMLIVDGSKLRQVLLNLVGNAVKFTTAGEVEVSARILGAAKTVPSFVCSPGVAEIASDSPIYVQFDVRDTGVGIAPENHSRLFDPFVQLDASKSRQHSGVGLGLAITYDLVRIMGGGISVRSEKDKGATFTFSIVCYTVVESAQT